MSRTWKGLLLAGIQIALVSGIGAKLRYDRSTKPRVWVHIRPWDPDAPIRGRYLALQLEMPARGFTVSSEPAKRTYPGYVPQSFGSADLQLQNGELVAVKSVTNAGTFVTLVQKNGQLVARISQPVAIYIPEDAKNPLIAPHGQIRPDAWVEVTLPKRGPPRPIRLGIKTNGAITPLELH